MTNKFFMDGHNLKCSLKNYLFVFCKHHLSGFFQRISLNGSVADTKETDSANGDVSENKAPSGDVPSSSLVFGYLNLFSDGVVSSVINKLMLQF